MAHLARGELDSHDEEQESLWYTITSILDTIRAKLTEAVTSVLSQMLATCKGLAHAVTSVVSSVVTLLGSVITLAIQHNSTTVKVALGAGILAALTSFIANVSHLFSQMGSWDSKNAQAAAIDLTSKITSTITSQPEVVANNLDFKTWITVGVTSLVAVLFAGLGLSGAVTWRDLVTGSNVVEGMRKTQANVQNLADFILKDLAGLEMDKDYPQCLALETLAEEGAKLQQHSVADFVQKPDLLYALRTYVSKVIKTTTQKVSAESSRRYASVRQLLIEVYRQLSNKLDAINAILATKPRQVTVGVMLSGPPGHGKSEFGKYICKRVARALGYPDSIYCLNKKADGFFEPYGGAAIGCFNEFMAMRSEDAILKDLNLILSSDPMNFEAACLEGKSQPCQLKIVFLTSNSHNPEIIRVLSEGAVKAMWDRMYHIAVEDPRCRGRHYPNEHRKPDFSHLEFNLVKHLSPDNIEMSPISLATIEERLIGRCANAERDFIKTVLDTEQSEPIASALLDRHQQLGHLLLTNHPFDDVTPNALGREFFILRLQGLPGSGKSTLAEQLAKECSGLFSYPIQYSRCEEEFKPEPFPTIYVLDDWVEPGNITTYVQRMNITHDRSIFILTSNTVFSKLSFKADPLGTISRKLAGLVGLTTAVPYDARGYGSFGVAVPQGCLRRIGLQGFITTETGQVIQTPELFQKTYTFGENFVVYDAYGRCGHREQILNTLFKDYRIFLTRPSEYVLVKGLPPCMKDPAVILEAPNAHELLVGLKSKKKCIEAYMGRANGFKLIVAPRLRGPTASSQTMVSTWLVVEEPSNDPAVLESIWSRMCATFGRTFPGESLLLRLTETGQTYYYEGGIAYTYGNDTLAETIPVEFQGDTLVYHRDSTTPIVVSAAQFAAARLYNQFDGPMMDCDISIFRAINRAFAVEVAKGTTSPFVTYYKIEEQRAHAKYSTRALWLKTHLKHNPIFWIGVSLLSMVCVGGIIYGFIRLCQAIKYQLSFQANPNSDPPKESRGRNPAKDVLTRITHVTRYNSDSPHESRGRTYAKTALRATAPMSRGARSNAHHEIWQPGILDTYEIPINNQPLPSEVNKVVEHLKTAKGHDEFNLKDYLLRHPDFDEDIILEHPPTAKVYDNMLRMEDMIKQEPSMLETMHSSIRRSYVQVNTSDGVCYGLHLQHNLILTVSHMFEKVGDPCSIINEAKSYSAKCVLIERERDLAVVKVTTSKFPQLPSSKKFFTTDEEVGSSKYGFFMRCGPECQVLGGLINFYDKTSYPITSSDNQNFNLSERVIVHVATALNRTRDFIKLGDCGFPLVARTSIGYRVLGIHNAYNQTEKSYYSTFTLADYEHFVRECSIKPNQDSPTSLDIFELVPANHVGIIPTLYADAICESQEEVKYSQYSDRLHIIGFSRQLAIRSNPRDSHKQVTGPDMITKPLTLPAAYTLNYVEDTSKLAVDSCGIPSPLFTQCLKYDAREVPTFDTDLFDEAAGIVMQDCVSRYSGCKILSLYESINGIRGRPLVPVDTTSSGGPLLKILYGIHTKGPVLKPLGSEGGSGMYPNTDIPAGKMVFDHYKEYRRALLEDCLPPLLLSKDCAKVELIDASKAREGKVRLFNEVDFSINLLFRSFFGDFATKVMEQHNEAPIRMGQNPYVTSTNIHRQFNEIEGRIVSTDFSAFDKQLPMELIHKFCWIVANCMDYRAASRTPYPLEEIYYQIAKSLTYVLHTCKGTIYLVDRGNESGTYVTTILNSVSVDILTTYTLVRRWREIFKFTPTLSELNAHCRKAILGDDRALKVSSILNVLEHDLVEDSKLFCLKCTPAKTSSGLDFCSRAITWDKRYQIAWPALKVSSVTSQLHWTRHITEDQILANCDAAMFEAALHDDPQLFHDVFSDVLALIWRYSIRVDQLAFHSRDTIRRRFIDMVRFNPTHEHILKHARQDHDPDSLDYVIRCKRSYDLRRSCSDGELAERLKDYKALRNLIATSDLSKIQSSRELNPVGYLHDLLTLYNLKDRPHGSAEQKVRADKSISWTYVVELYDVLAIGQASSKRDARNQAFTRLLDKLLGSLSITA